MAVLGDKLKYTGKNIEEDENLLKSAEFIPDPALPVNLLRRAPQPQYPLHAHEFSELVIIYAGEGTHFTRDGASRVRAGDVFFIQGNTAHGYREVRGLKLINIIFDLKNLESPISDLPLFPAFHVLFTLEPELRTEKDYAGHFNLNPAQLEQVMAAADRMEEEIARNEPGRGLMVTALFMQLVALLIRWYEQTPPQRSPKLEGIGKALSYLNRNFQHKISVRQLADIANMSESSLTRAFRKAVGMPPVMYCCRLRIHKALNMLINTEMSISEIADITGFEDSNYFSRMFRQFTGNSPRDYRKISRI
jgi:AraC-like DNA-binding protein/quercetin dioxygenase-like cupin family protein